MIEKDKVTCAYLDLKERGYGDGYSAGCELWKDNSVYCIFSIYLPKSEFKNKTRALRHLFSLVLNEIDENEELILFYSSMNHFFRVKRLHQLTAEFKKGRNVRFFRAVSTRSTVEELELDAATRKDSIIEHL
jgi:hypothetical protein